MFLFRSFRVHQQSLSLSFAKPRLLGSASNLLRQLTTAHCKIYRHSKNRASLSNENVNIRFVFQALLVPLQQFVREQFLTESPDNPSRDNIERGVSRVVAEWSTVFESATVSEFQYHEVDSRLVTSHSVIFFRCFQANLQPNDNIDFEATLTTFIEHHMTSISHLILQSTRECHVTQAYYTLMSSL